MLSIVLLVFGFWPEPPTDEIPGEKNAVFFMGLRKDHVRILFTATTDPKKNHHETTSILKLLTQSHPHFFNTDFDPDDGNERGFKFKHKNTGDIIWIYRAGNMFGKNHLIANGLLADGSYSEQILVDPNTKRVFVQAFHRRKNLNDPSRIQELYECGYVTEWEQTE